MPVQFEMDLEVKSIIKVIGVGGGGCNAVNFMHNQGIVGVDFAICNTDNQSLQGSDVPVKIQLGPNLTEGRGAGAKPEIGRQSCIESMDDIKAFLENGTKMLFIASGMGGGTGTGAAPLIAKAAKEMDILTIGIVTVPFRFEGKQRKKFALEGIKELRENVDACIIVSNERLREVHGNLPLSKAFNFADNILSTAAKGIAEIITVPGYINVDFEDVNTVMRDSGIAIMGTAVSEGDDRAIKAVREALNSPLLEDNDIRGAENILLNISSGDQEVTMDEVCEITDYIIDEAGEDVNLIWGNCSDEALGDKLMVTIIATGFDEHKQTKYEEQHSKKTTTATRVEPVVVALDEEADQPLDTSTYVERKAVYANSDKTNVIEYDSKSKMDRIIKDRYASSDPYFKEKSELIERKSHLISDLDKKETNFNNIVELENKPAYLRRNVQLEDVDHSTEFKRSTTVVNMEGTPEVRTENPYLFDNVD